MQDEKKWPYYPSCLTKVIKKGLIEILLSGISDRIESPVMAYDLCKGLSECSEDVFIFTTDSDKRYPNFCIILRNEIPGGKKLCHQSTFENVVETVEREEKGLSIAEEPLRCHMGLNVFYHPIVVAGRIVAVCSGGNFLLPDGISLVEKRIEELKDRLKTFSEEQEKRLKDSIRFGEKPISLTNDKNKAKDFGRRFVEDVNKISEVAEGYFRRHKEENEWKFKDKIATQLSYISAEEVIESINKILEEVKDFISVSYIGVFISRNPQETVLPLVSHAGFTDPKIETKVHFNWRKSGLSLQPSTDSEAYLSDPKYGIGIRGEAEEVFKNISYLIPYSYRDGHRGVMVLGPFFREHQEAIDIKQEENFLDSVGYTIVLRIMGLLTLNFLKEKEQQRNLMIALTAHSIRSRLHTLLTEAYELETIWRKEYFTKDDKDRVNLAIETINEEVKVLAEKSELIMRAPTVIAVDVDKSEVKLQAYSLAVLVGNCVERFIEYARLENISFNVDDASIDKLSSAMIEPYLIDQALANLIDNAIKYSQKGRAIKIYGKQPTVNIATIIIEDYGWGIPEKDLHNIFKPGYRSEIRRKIKDTLGVGLGLFQAKEFIELNNGKIVCESQPAYKGAPLTDYVTKFTITIPTIL